MCRAEKRRAEAAKRVVIAYCRFTNETLSDSLSLAGWQTFGSDSRKKLTKKKPAWVYYISGTVARSGTAAYGKGRMHFSSSSIG